MRPSRSDNVPPNPALVPCAPSSPWGRAAVRAIGHSCAANWNWRSLRRRALPPLTGFRLDVIANFYSGSRSSSACKFRPTVLAGGVSFPLTLALSRRERGHPIPRCDESRRSGLAKTQRALLPLPKGEGRGEGEATLETPRGLRTADEHNDKGTVRSGIQRRDTRTTRRVGFAKQRQAIPPLLGGEGRGEGERSPISWFWCNRAVDCSGLLPSCSGANGMAASANLRTDKRYENTPLF